MSLLDFLFPKKCVNCKKFGEYLCPSCFAQLSFEVFPKCLVCGRQSFNGMTHPKCQTRDAIDGCFSAVVYKRIAKKLLYQFKYQPFLTDLQTVLVELLYESLIQHELFVAILEKRPLLVPIPLFKNKLRKRGYNQAEILAKGLGKKFELEVVHVLQRTKDTKPQYGLKREEREENIKWAFEVGDGLWGMGYGLKEKVMQPHPGPLLKGEGKHRSILLIDDVLTTGSTLKEAAKVLKKHGYEKVWGVTWAQD